MLGLGNTFKYLNTFDKYLNIDLVIDITML